MSYFSRLFVPVLERYEQNDEDKKVDGGVSVASETDTTRDKLIKTEKDDKTSQVDVARVSPPTAAKSETAVTTSTATGARPFGTITTRGDASPQAAVTQLSIAAKDKTAGNGGALETPETPASPMDEASPAETHVKDMAVDENTAKDTPMDEAPVDEKLTDEARTDDDTRMAENFVEDTLRSSSVDGLPEKEAMQVDNDNQSMGDALSVGDNDDDQPVTIDITADTDNDNDDDVDYSLLDDDDGFAASVRDKMAQKRRAPVDDDEDVGDERVDGPPESSEPPKPPLPVKRGPGRPPKHKGPGRPRKYPKPEKIAKSKRAYTPLVTPNKQDDEIQKTPEKQGKKDKEARANGFQPAFQQSLPQMFPTPFQAPFQQPYMSPFPMQQAMGSFVDPATGIMYQPTIVYQPVYPPGAMQQPSMMQPMMPPPMIPMMMPPQQGTASSSSSSSAAATSSSSSSSTSMVPAYWPQQQQQAQMMMMPWMNMPPYTTTPPQSSPSAPPTMTSTPTPAIQRVASPVPSTTSGESRESSVLSDPDGGDDDDNPEVHRGLRHRRIERRKLHLATRASLEDLDIDETTPLTKEDKLLIGLFNTATRRDLFALRPDNYVKDRGMHTLRSRRPLINKTDLVSFMNQDRVKWSNISVAYINVHKLISRLDKWVWPNVDKAGLELEHVLSSWRRQLERDDNKDDDDDDNKDGDKDKAQDNQVPLLTSPPINMSPALDEYQLMGINWMDTLFVQKMAGVLVDQQDPAKRVAMMVAFLARQVQLQKHKAGVHLLIIGADDGPIEMWKRQFDAFKPLLTMKTYLGTNPERARTRPILASTPGIDVILTTATIGIESIPDRTFLSGLHIASLILDGCSVHGKPTTYPTTLFQYKRIQVRILLVSDEPTNIYTNYVLLSRFILPQQFYGHTQVMAIDFRPFFRTPQELAAIKNDPADNHMPPSDLTNTFDKVAAHFQTAVRRFALLHHTRHELAIAMASTRSLPATST
ncbi:hypothetical protein BC940DRAFT_308324 [Gongronella butleri]|nr:hypothetical protein BC940DRAFT_308324 [Gongronella butleri]